MNQVKVKQGTLHWEQTREARIGSSEVFDIVRYYASAEELQNCGISAEDIMAETPYTSVWALYHKMIRDGIFQREALAPEYAEYGHAIEPYGLFVLQQNRKRRLKPGEVYASDRLIVSLDISGTSEEIDCVPFDVGNGMAPVGKKFVCEQKSMHPERYKAGLPIKYIIQAQYQALMVDAAFFIIQIMVLKDDTVFERGKITQMGLSKRKKYLKDKMDVHHIYFRFNDALAALIETCIGRFFDDVDAGKEPTPYITLDKTRNIVNSIRANSFFDAHASVPFDLSGYIDAKQRQESAEKDKREILQSVVETAKKWNAVKFRSPDGTFATFSRDGKFLVRPPKGDPNGED